MLSAPLNLDWRDITAREASLRWQMNFWIAVEMLHAHFHLCLPRLCGAFSMTVERSALIQD
jgi:hypothetical protein